MGAGHPRNRLRGMGFVDRHAKWLFPLPAMVFIFVMMIFPLIYTLYNSFTGWSLSSGAPRTWNHFANYARLVHDDRFLLSIVRMFYFTVAAVAVELIIGTAVAVFLNRSFRGKNIIQALLLLPMMATPVAVAMVWMLMFEPTAGIVNYLLSIVGLPQPGWLGEARWALPTLILLDVWEWSPMITLMALAGLTNLSSETLEAAAVDGATPWQTFWRITLPLLRPTLTVAVLLRVIDALKWFDTIYATTGGGPGYATETLNIYTYQQAFSYFNFGYVSSILVVFFAIVLGISLLLSVIRGRVEA
ncbi:MAG: sugar ABC transporter permease [Firmicutes bacterium]|nr:sugar ABC transporter permease [Bacillota bacterium]